MNSKISAEEMETLKRAFQLYDKDEDGMIEIDEFKTIIMSLDKTKNTTAALAMAQSSDKNGDRMIDFDEFVCAMIQLLPFSPPDHQHPERHELKKSKTCPHFSSQHHEQEDLVECFRQFDTNHDGLISRHELSKVMHILGEDLSEQDLIDMMNEADANRDGYIDFEEFKRLLN